MLFLWFADISPMTHKDPSSILPQPQQHTTSNNHGHRGPTSFVVTFWRSDSHETSGEASTLPLRAIWHVSRSPRAFLWPPYSSPPSVVNSTAIIHIYCVKITWLSPKASHHSQTSKIANRHQHNMTYLPTIPPHHHQSPPDYLTFLFHLVFSNLFNVAATQQLSNYHTVHFYFGWARGVHIKPNTRPFWVP